MYPKVPTTLNFFSNSKFFCEQLRKLAFFFENIHISPFDK